MTNIGLLGERFVQDLLQQQGYSVRALSPGTKTVDLEVDGHPMSRIDDLLPWNWSPASVKP